MNAAFLHVLKSRAPSPAAINSESENDEYVCVICLFLKGKYLEKYMVLNMKMGNGKLGRIEN